MSPLSHLTGVMSMDIDLTQAAVVEITISNDGTKIWVDIDGPNRVRVYGIKQLVLRDFRDGGNDD
jgi:hypothetical protein